MHCRGATRRRSRIEEQQKTPKRLGYEPNIINTPKQFPACSVPKIFWMLSQSAQTKGLIANQQDAEKKHAHLFITPTSTQRNVFTSCVCHRRFFRRHTLWPSEKDVGCFNPVWKVSPSVSNVKNCLSEPSSSGATEGRGAVTMKESFRLFKTCVYMLAVKPLTGAYRLSRFKRQDAIKQTRANSGLSHT